MPEDAATLVTLGWVYMADFNSVVAERHFRRAVASDAKLAEAHGGLACALVYQFRVDEARRSVRRARSLDKRCFGAGYAMSIMSEMRGRHAAAEKILASYLERRPRADGPSAIETVNVALARKLHPKPGSDAPVPVVRRD